MTPVVPAPQESVLKPVPLNPILKTPGPLKPVPVKKVCKPMDSQLHILQRDLPELKDLVSEGILKPGTQVLSLFTGVGTKYLGSRGNSFILPSIVLRSC